MYESLSNSIIEYLEALLGVFLELEPKESGVFLLLKVLFEVLYNLTIDATWELPIIENWDDEV